MKTRGLHRIIGLVMLLPLIGWAITGALFFLKPGYSDAYETLQVKAYPYETEVRFLPDPSWIETRFVRTILGEHLLARTSEGWLHLDPRSFRPLPEPSAEDVRALVDDAISQHSARYGRIVSVTGSAAITDTRIRIEVDWKRLALSQRGPDTDRIDAFYRVHYLQWTGSKSIDRVLGAIGILLLFALSGLGARLFFSRGHQ
jgi:hypothetical protein